MYMQSLEDVKVGRSCEHINTTAVYHHHQHHHHHYHHRRHRRHSIQARDVSQAFRVVYPCLTPASSYDAVVYTLCCPAQRLPAQLVREAIAPFLALLLCCTQNLGQGGYSFYCSSRSARTGDDSFSSAPPPFPFHISSFHLNSCPCPCLVGFRQLRQMRINELGNKVSDWEVKLKQQQQLYESVRSDRNLYSKNLIEAQDEIAEMKRKLKIMNHQIEQLKEDITAKVIGLRARRVRNAPERPRVLLLLLAPSRDVSPPTNP